LRPGADFDGWIGSSIERVDGQLLPISLDALSHRTRLPFYHRDPFDRMLVAQAKSNNLVLISADTALDEYGARRIW